MADDWPYWVTGFTAGLVWERWEAYKWEVRLMEIRVLVEKVPGLGYQATAFDEYGQIAQVRAKRKDHALSGVQTRAQEMLGEVAEFVVEDLVGEVKK